MSPAEPKTFEVKHLQAWVGLTALLLPVALWIFGVLIDDGSPWPWPMQSISDYHDTNIRVLLVGALAVIGVLMLCYRGYEDGKAGRLSDNFLANIAGSAALLVAAIPNDPDCKSLGQMLPYPMATWAHFAAAATVFVSMWWFCQFRFTESAQANRSDGKIFRNKVFKFCAAVILASSVILLAGFILNWWQQYPTGIFVFESTGMMGFGVGWLVKSKLIGESKFVRTKLPPVVALKLGD